MNSEMFKATMLKQLKDRNSDIYCLVHNSYGYGSPFVFYSSEFNVRIVMRWEAFIYKGKSEVTRWYQFMFDDNKSDRMIDLSDPDLTSVAEFSEEVIELDGSSIILGISRFKLEHNNYEFKKIYEGGLVYPQVFDFGTYKTESIEETDANLQWHAEKHKKPAAQSSGNMLNQSVLYLNYYFSDSEEKQIENHLKLIGLSDKEIKDILSTLRMGSRAGTSPLIGIHRALLHYCKTNKK